MKHMMYHFFQGMLLVLLPGFSAGEPYKTRPEIPPLEAKQIAKEAYIFGFPMVVNYKTVWNYPLDKQSDKFKSDFNVTSCDSKVWTPADKAVAPPNSDNPYCIFWADISQEPTVVSVLKTDENLFIMVFATYYEVDFLSIGTSRQSWLIRLKEGIQKHSSWPLV